MSQESVELTVQQPYTLEVKRSNSNVTCINSKLNILTVSIICATVVYCQVLNALLLERPSGVPDTAAALRTVYQTVFTPGRGARPGVPRIAIVVTSGLSVSISATGEAADAARRSGVEIYAVAYEAGGRPDMQEIAAIADSSPNHIFTLGNASGTPSAVASALLDQLCQA